MPLTDLMICLSGACVLLQAVVGSSSAAFKLFVLFFIEVFLMWVVFFYT